jgi:hypothetical protein
MRETYKCTLPVHAVALLLGAWLLSSQSYLFAQGQPISSVDNPLIAELLSTNPPPPGFATRLDYVKSFTNEKDIGNAYQGHLINKGEAMLATRYLESRASMDIYGKVVDQNGEPVTGAKVRGSVNVAGDFIEHYTKTDGEGRFSFLGLQGETLYILPEKEGYDYNSNLPSDRPKDYLPDRNKPLVFTMWRLHGPEPMTHADIESSVSRHGTTRTFSLLTGKRDISGGLAVQLVREPVEIAAKDLRKPFNWSLTLAITNGGLLGYANQPYPYEAPSEGYQTIITINFPTNMIGWQSWFKHDYYFNDQNGQIYGRMTIEVHAGAPTPEAYFKISDYANPAGSRNLEYDPKKQIQK